MNTVTGESRKMNLGFCNNTIKKWQINLCCRFLHARLRLAARDEPQL